MLPMDNLFFMTANRFQKPWMRRLVDEARKDPERMMMKVRQLGWTDTYCRIADYVAMEAWLETNRAGFAAYVLPDPMTCFGGYTLTIEDFYFGLPAHTLGNLSIITVALRGAYPTTKKENHGFI